MSIDEMKMILGRIQPEGQLSVPAHLGFPFMSTSFATTMARLAVVFNHLKNKNSQYPLLTVVQAADLKDILTGYVKTCDIVVKNMSDAQSSVQCTTLSTTFDVFTFLPEEIRKSIWAEAMSFEEFVATCSNSSKWQNADAGLHILKEELFDRVFTTTKKSFIRLVSKETYRVARSMLIHLSGKHIIMNSATDTLYWRDFFRSESWDSQWPKCKLLKRVAVDDKYWISDLYQLHVSLLRVEHYDFEEIMILVRKDRFYKDGQLHVKAESARPADYSYWPTKIFGEVSKDSTWEDLDNALNKTAMDIIKNGSFSSMDCELFNLPVVTAHDREAMLPYLPRLTLRPNYVDDFLQAIEDGDAPTRGTCFI